jgi:hypothetical protein
VDTSLLVYVLEGSIVDLSMSMSMGEAMLPMLMSMCKELGWVIVASVHVHVYVLGVNVASVHVQVDGLGRGIVFILTTEITLAIISNSPFH